jgi:hypothetical protein
VPALTNDENARGHAGVGLSGEDESGFFAHSFLASAFSVCTTPSARVVSRMNSGMSYINHAGVGLSEEGEQARSDDTAMDATDVRSSGTGDKAGSEFRSTFPEGFGAHYPKVFLW